MNDFDFRILNFLNLIFIWNHFSNQELRFKSIYGTWFWFHVNFAMISPVTVTTQDACCQTFAGFRGHVNVLTLNNTNNSQTYKATRTVRQKCGMLQSYVPDSDQIFHHRTLCCKKRVSRFVLKVSEQVFNRTSEDIISNGGCSRWKALAGRAQSELARDGQWRQSGRAERAADVERAASAVTSAKACPASAAALLPNTVTTRAASVLDHWVRYSTCSGPAAASISWLPAGYVEKSCNRPDRWLRG